MINAQKWLDENYPKYGTCIRESEQNIPSYQGEDSLPFIDNWSKTRKEITHLFISGYDYNKEKNNPYWNKLSGTLDLSDFINLEYLVCDFNQLTSLILPKNNKISYLDCSFNQLTNLDIRRCVNLEHLNCHTNQLTRLDLTNSHNCKNLLCWDNQLTRLILPSSNQLMMIRTGGNHFTNFDYSVLNPQTLTDLRLWNNNLEPTDLAVFSNLVNLNNLSIGSSNAWVETGKYNKFYGSLQSLKNCTKLEGLRIENTNINAGLEYLNPDLKEFVYYPSKGSNFKVQEIEWQLKSQSKDYKPKDSMIYWHRWMSERKINELKTQINNLNFQNLNLFEILQEQRQNTIKALGGLLPEKDLLLELIDAHLEMTRFKKYHQEDENYDETLVSYEKRFESVNKKIDSKEVRNNIRIVLNEFELLVQREFDLETNLNKKLQLVNDKEWLEGQRMFFDQVSFIKKDGKAKIEGVNIYRNYYYNCDQKQITYHNLGDVINSNEIPIKELQDLKEQLVVFANKPKYQSKYSITNHGNIATIGDNSQGKIYQFDSEEESDYHDAESSFSDEHQFEAFIETI